MKNAEIQKKEKYINNRNDYTKGDIQPLRGLIKNDRKCKIQKKEKVAKSFPSLLPNGNWWKKQTTIYSEKSRWKRWREENEEDSLLKIAHINFIIVDKELFMILASEESVVKSKTFSEKFWERKFENDFILHWHADYWTGKKKFIFRHSEFQNFIEFKN